MTIGAAIAASLCKALIRSRPKRRKTPATMPMTMGIGSSDMTRFIQPLAPMNRMSTLVA